MSHNTTGISGPIPKKSLGQHWLDDDASLDAMLAAVDIGPDDTVLEIGPGLGSLTRKLVTVAKEVVAVEFDSVLALSLPQRMSVTNLQVIEQDILRFDYTALPAGYKLVANIPYYLTSNLLRTISETANPPARAAILVQKEVAQRVAAPAGAMSLLSITAQFYWEVSLGRTVTADLFTPPPKVDSQILILEQRASRLFPDVDPKLFFRLAKAGFGERRKTLRNSLSGGLRLEKPQAEELLRTAGLDPGLRAQSLTLEQWHGLYVTYVEYTKQWQPTP
jgi:16S rRNA (adenine1518-N6/adenine1519-N6)-dimethyltransferase